MSVISLKDYIDLENYSHEEEQQSGENTEEEDEGTVKISSDSSDTLSEPDSLIQEIEELSHDREKELKERLESLRAKMDTLKGELQREKELCKKLVEELTSHDNHTECMYSSHCHHRNINGFPTAATYPNCMPLNEYEMQMNNYQDALRQAQTYNKISLQRQLAITNYRRRLLEVENMCNLELLKVKQSVQNLQPLRQIVSEWEREMSGAEGDSNNFVPKRSEDNEERSNMHRYDPSQHSRGDCNEAPSGDEDTATTLSDQDN